MTPSEFEAVLESVKNQLNAYLEREGKFTRSRQFEDKVRDLLDELGLDTNRHSSAQAFPDIAIGQFGIEVKFTEQDTWRSIANSISE